MNRADALSAVVRWRTHTTREGRLWLAASGLLWFTGWLKGINLILLLSYAIFALWVLNWWIARRSLQGLTARRIVSPPVFAGAPAVWEVEIADQGIKPFSGLRILDDGPSHHAEWFVLELRAGGRTRLRREVTLPQRGRYDCTPLRAECAYPFGLVTREAQFADALQLMVLPRLGTVNAGRLRRWLAQTARPDERTRRSRRKLATEVEFHGLRTFRPGDSPRWIHWRTSARRGELMVREFDQGAHHDLCLFVEPFAARPGDPALEAALELAATICWQWAEDVGDRVVLAVMGARGNVVADDRLAQLECLAGIEGEAQPGIDEVVKRLERVALPVGPALLVASRDAGRTAEILGRRLGRSVALIDTTRLPDFYQPPAEVKNPMRRSHPMPDWSALTR
ncbi:MAG: DUF58 domain-containing protein [Gemmataceae bacterium]